MKTILSLTLGALCALLVSCERREPHGSTTGQATTAKDPVCSMTVDTATAKDASYEGRKYYFCSTDCRDKFKQAPTTYLPAPGPTPNR